MDTKAIIGLIVAIVVIGGGAWYFSSQKSVGTSGDALEQQADTMKESKGMGTFAELIGKVGTWKCTVRMNVAEAPSEGVAYIADGKVRADFTSKVQALGGKEVQSSMIQTDGYVYTWSNMMPQGMKMKVPLSNDPAVSEMVPDNYTEQVDYDCGPWMMDASKFTPPAEVSFMELGANNLPAGMPTGYPVPN